MHKLSNLNSKQKFQTNQTNPTLTLICWRRFLKNCVQKKLQQVHCNNEKNRNSTKNIVSTQTLNKKKPPKCLVLHSLHTSALLQAEYLLCLSSFAETQNAIGVASQITIRHFPSVCFPISPSQGRYGLICLSFTWIHTCDVNNWKINK